MSLTPPSKLGSHTSDLPAAGTTQSADTTDEVDPSAPPTPVRREDSTEPSEAFDTTIEEIGRRIGSNDFNPVAHLEDLGRRRLGLDAKSPTTVMLAGLFGMGIRLGPALLVTAIAGQLSSIPWGRWVVILVFYFLYDATQPFRTPLLDAPLGPQHRLWMGDYTALLTTVERESDLQDLAEFARRWFRFPVAITVGAVVAGIMLLACQLLAPIGLSELHAGSLVLLLLLLFDFGASTVSPSSSAMWVREARYDHRLFWPSPADSPEVQRSMSTARFFGRNTAMWATLHLVLVVVLVSWDSQLVVPLSAGYIVIGYLYTFASAAVVRSAIQTIVTRSRNRRLERLRRRIEALEDHFEDLSADESEQAQRLIDLHNAIRDAPTTPTSPRTVVRSAAALIVPTIVFIITVFGEVSAERMIDAILP